MKVSYHLYRRMLLICAFFLVILSIVLILGVIPAIKEEVMRGGTPEKAVTAFWVNIGFNALSAISIIVIALKSKGRSWISTSLLVFVGFIIMLLGLALADAASAYQKHGPSMQSASLFLFICAAADFLAGLTVITTAFLLPKKLK
jgi:hypothetical protein